eukprot:1197388-Amphidinium_carterae.1
MRGAVNWQQQTKSHGRKPWKPGICSETSQEANENLDEKRWKENLFNYAYVLRSPGSARTPKIPQKIK